MNENERTPAETAADYAVHFADGFFVPCPCCGKEVKSPDNGFTSEKEAMEWALGACDCEGASMAAAAPGPTHGQPLRGRENEGGPLRAYRLYGPLYRIRLQCIPPGTIRPGTVCPRLRPVRQAQGR